MQLSYDLLTIDKMHNEFSIYDCCSVARLLLFVTSQPVCSQEGSAGRAGAHISLPAAAASVVHLHALPPATA